MKTEIFLVMAKKKKGGRDRIKGSQRPLAFSGGVGDYQRRFDLEIKESIVREGQFTREILEASEYCYEVVHTCDLASNAVFGSTDGDDQGFTVARDYLFPGIDERQPIHPDTYRIALEVIERRRDDCFVIGGDKLKKALQLYLSHGECFLEIGLGLDPMGSGEMVVTDLLYLPTFEMFRKEDDHGVLERFEQRRMLQDYDAVTFDPWKIIHARHKPLHLYGQSAWKTSIATGIWHHLKESTRNLAIAARDLGINPNVHKFAEGTNKSIRETYIDEFEARKHDGPVTDLYMLPGGEVEKLSSQNPNLRTLIEIMLEWRYRMILPGMPLYFWPGIMNGSARELSAQPAFQYARLRNEWCSVIAMIVRRVIDTEIRLRKGDEFFRRNGKYQVIFPYWDVAMESGAGANNDESDAAGMTDLDSEQEDKPDAQPSQKRF